MDHWFCTHHLENISENKESLRFWKHGGLEAFACVGMENK